MGALCAGVSRLVFLRSAAIKRLEFCVTVISVFCGPFAGN